MKKISPLLNHLSTKYDVKVTSATTVRKVLAVSECSPSQLMKLSKTMLHGIDTHKRYYETHSSKQSAVRASKISSFRMIPVLKRSKGRPTGDTDGKGKDAALHL